MRAILRGLVWQLGRPKVRRTMHGRTNMTLVVRFLVHMT